MSRAVPPIFVALDTTEIGRAQALVRSLTGAIGGIKLGLEYFSAQGPAGIAAVAEISGLPLFLDLKFHDIPNTVAGAVRAVAALRPAYLTLHASGGSAMMNAAREAAFAAADRFAVAPPRLLAVTVLTSLNREDLSAVGQDQAVAGQVHRLAGLAHGAGLDGVVCSPAEVAILRAAFPPPFLLVVPGIRPAWATAGDQKRVMTPAQALAAGADFLVIGRPITAAADPAEAAHRIVAELDC